MHTLCVQAHSQDRGGHWVSPSIRPCLFPEAGSFPGPRASISTLLEASQLHQPSSFYPLRSHDCGHAQGCWICHWAAGIWTPGLKIAEQRLIIDEPFLLSQKQLRLHILLLFTLFSCLLRLDLKSFKDPVFPELTCLRYNCGVKFDRNLKWITLIPAVKVTLENIPQRNPWCVKKPDKDHHTYQWWCMEGVPGSCTLFTVLIPRVFEYFPWILVLVCFRSQLIM